MGKILDGSPLHHRSTLLTVLEDVDGHSGHSLQSMELTQVQRYDFPHRLELEMHRAQSVTSPIEKALPPAPAK